MAAAKGKKIKTREFGRWVISFEVLASTGERRNILCDTSGGRLLQETNNWLDYSRCNEIADYTQKESRQEVEAAVWPGDALRPNRNIHWCAVLHPHSAHSVHFVDWNT